MKIKKILVANRGEIAIRIFRSSVEIGLKTVAIYTHEDRYSLHRYKADESYQVGKDDEPLKPYLDMDEIIRVAVKNDVDAIHPGYGFLSENPEFARKCRENNIIWVGPSPEAMAQLGDKISAKKLAAKINVPLIESSKAALTNSAIALKEADQVGYPVMLKATAGGGGRGMRIARSADELQKLYPEATREALNAFGDGTVFLEKYVEDPKHIEVQIMADQHGNTVHLFERDCSVQRRFQKVVEVAPAYGLGQDTKEKLYTYALSIAKAVQYDNVGTVEFLVDKNESVFFIEVNPRIQVEHTVTEMVTGVDLIKAQIFIAGGYALGDEQIKVPSQEGLKTNGYAVQCRITTEDPENNFKPDYGTIITYRSAAGFGIRLDAGSLYQGMKISPFFDSMLVKVSAHSRTLDGASRKMLRALREFRIRGVKTNVPFLENIIKHPHFKTGKATVNFIQKQKSLFKFDKRLDRATKVVKYLGDVIVNGNPDVKVIDKSKPLRTPKIPSYDPATTIPKGTKHRLIELGPEKFCEWLKDEKKIYYTDTTLRDGHQSLLATRMRTIDMTQAAASFAQHHPQTFSMEVWGGATFDVCMRFLLENPWRRLRELRAAVPNILLQMLIRGSNAVGYTAYPDNLIESFVEKSWEEGIDVFRIFDSLNWLNNMEPCIQFVRNRTRALAEVSICYTGDILDPAKTKYTLDYYVTLAKQIEEAGAHLIAIKDMAGLLKPYAASELVSALKDAVNLPVHLHTHDTSSLQSATYLKAIEAGVDVVDVALGGMSGLTSQPNFNAVVEMMKGQEREHPYDIASLNEFSTYWEVVREHYYPFESGLKAGTAGVYLHEIPGGQYSNLKPQAESLGLLDQFEEIKQRYAEVNTLFGNIVKVTPSSKVVGDMALYMVSNGLTTEDILERGEALSFPESVRALFRGDLGQPDGGFPKKLQKIILKDEKPYTNRPNAHLEPVDLDAEFETFLQKFQPRFDRTLEYTDFLSYMLYPKVFEDTYKRHLEFGDVSRIPTRNFFYGMELHEETIVEIADGKRIIVQLLSVGPPDVKGFRTVFFKVNGQTRNIQIKDNALQVEKSDHEKADPANEKQVGVPLQGLLSKIMVKKGQQVKKNEPFFIIEAMKMETTVTANENCEIKSVHLKEGVFVEAEDLVVSLK